MDVAEEIYSLIAESRSLEYHGDIAASIRQAQQACHLAQLHDDTEGEATALNVLAYAHIRLGHYEQARKLCRQVLVLAGAEASSHVDALLNLGICAGETNDLDALEDSCAHVIDLSRQIGYHRGLIRGLHTLSCMVYMPRGQFKLALAIDEEALNIAQTQGQMDLAWGPLLTMSYVQWLLGQQSLARARLAQLQQATEPGSLGDGYWHYIHANLALEAGEVEQARHLFTRTLSIAEANGISENLFLARLGMSRLYRVLQDAPTAFAWANEALATVQRSGYHHLQAQALIERSRAAWAMVDLANAEADLRAAIALLAPQRLDFDLAIATLLLAALLHQQNHSDASRVWQEACTRLVQGGFIFLADRERALAFPLILQGLKSSEPSIIEASNNLLQYLQRAMPPSLRITTLGGWRIQTGNHRVDTQLLRQRRAGELLALLLISPGRSLTVEQAMDVLWPDKDPASAQPLLYHATSILRRALEPDLPDKFPCRYLRVEDGKVALILPPDSEVDYEIFLRHIRQEKWDAALSCYGGVFLPEYRYVDWAEAQRRWLAQNYQRALLIQAAIWLSEGQFQQTLDACHKILADEPWQEQAVLLGMQACIGLGNSTVALRLYRNLEKVLHAELGVEPQTELQALYHSLRKR